MGLTFAAPALAKVVLAPALATWADGEGGARRAGAAWGSLGAAAAALLAAGSWVRHAGCCAAPDGGGAATPALVVGLVALADVITQAAIPVHWSLHHASQPAELRGCSIAVVNSVGNLGGFAGPFVLGWLHDAAPRGACGACLAQWGGGIVSVGGFLLAATACSRSVLLSRPDWTGGAGYAKPSKSCEMVAPADSPTEEQGRLHAV